MRECSTRTQHCKNIYTCFIWPGNKLGLPFLQLTPFPTNEHFCKHIHMDRGAKIEFSFHSCLYIHTDQIYFMMALTRKTLQKDEESLLAKTWF